jgi:hypothetical protein
VIAYEVTADVEEGVVERYIEFMRASHIPAILATGCFSHAEFNRASETRFRQRFLAANLADLERYLERHAPTLRAEYAKRFPQGTILTREIWEELKRWPAG